MELPDARENIAQRIERGDMARIAGPRHGLPNEASRGQHAQEDPMPTITRKAAILVRAGVVVPGHPAVGVSDEAVAAWNQQVDELSAAYVMSRAAQSLREAEEAQQRSRKRQVNAQLGQDDPKPRRPAAGPEG